MNTLQPIIIRPEQILAAAQKIVDGDSNAYQYTPEQYLAAVRNFLEASINDVVYDADWYAAKSSFAVELKYTFSVDYAEFKDLTLPNPPEWAVDQSLQPTIQ